MPRWSMRSSTARSHESRPTNVMKTVISAKDVEDLLRNGGDLKSLPADAIFTPSARDLLRDGANGRSTLTAAAVKPPSAPAPAAASAPSAPAVTAASSKAD